MRYKVEMAEENLWREFCLHQNEMIITKAGRCLFPLLRFYFHLVNPSSNDNEEGIKIQHQVEIEDEEYYNVSLCMVSTDDHKWKYRQGTWLPLLATRLGDKDDESRCNLFHENIKGHELIYAGINFDKLKLSNRQTPTSSQSVCLQSFRRYVPVVRISRSDHSDEASVQEIRFNETEFIAVTHYQNERITLLKKSYNPHAKGFVLSEGSPITGSIMNWMLTPEQSSSSPPPHPSEHFEHHQQQYTSTRKRVRSRVHPIRKSISSSEPAIPSDEEELQGSIALQLLSGGD